MRAPNRRPHWVLGLSIGRTYTTYIGNANKLVLLVALMQASVLPYRRGAFVPSLA
jgi:hypothetical protein